MRKKAFHCFLCLSGLIMALALGGCADSGLLQDILQTAALEDGGTGEETENGETGPFVGRIRRDGQIEEAEEPGREQTAGTEQAAESGRTAEADQIAESGRTTEAGSGTEPDQNAESGPTAESEQTAEPESFLYEDAFCYAYESLSEAERLWYRDIADSLGRMDRTTKLNKQGINMGLDETDVDKIFQCVLMDHPELFYVEGYTYTKYSQGGKLLIISFSGNFSADRDKAGKRMEEIRSAAQPLLDEAAGLTGDYDKVKYVYETVIRNTEYDLASTDNQNIYSVFVNHRSVCQGYAKAVQYLLNRMGVECALVQGTVDTGEGHAWNLVKVDGSYYYVDATWGDASYQSEDGEDLQGYIPEINYDYLCISTEQLLRTHILESCVPMPACVDTKDNYYVHEGALFQQYDREQMKVLFDRALAEGRQEVTLKCSDAGSFRQVKSALIDGQEIFDYLGDSSESVVYTHNEKQLSMTFWVTNP